MVTKKKNPVFSKGEQSTFIETRKIGGKYLKILTISGNSSFTKKQNPNWGHAGIMYVAVRAWSSISQSEREYPTLHFVLLVKKRKRKGNCEQWNQKIMLKKKKQNRR